MREVTVGTVNALAREGGEPAAAGGMKVGNDEAFALGRSSGSATRCGDSAAGCCSKKTEEAAPVHRVLSAGMDEWGRRSVCESVVCSSPDRKAGIAFQPIAQWPPGCDISPFANARSR